MSTPSSPSVAGLSHHLLLIPTSLKHGDEATQRVPLSPVTLWPYATIPSCHVLPGKLDRQRLENAMLKLVELYPVIAGRFGRVEKAGGGYEYSISLSNSPIPITYCTSTSLDPPFPSSAVIQPSLDLFLTPVDPTQLNVSPSDPAGALFTLRVTHFPSLSSTAKECTVLGLSWGHVLGDGSAFCTFTRLLSKVYEGWEVEEGEKPTFEPHVRLEERPSEEALQKWEHAILYPTFELSEAWGKYGAAVEETELVQLVITTSEIALLKELAATPGEGWVSSQDAMSSYWINILRSCGVDIETVVNSVNYRSFFPSHPSFPPNLPSLVANVAQLLSTSLPPSSTDLSLHPIARAIRGDLQDLQADPDRVTEWLSCRAYRMLQSADKGETQVMVPFEGDSIVNSNYRYDWNHSFGFDKSQSQHHTSFSIKNFLRVFRTNPSSAVQGAEWTFRVKTGLRERVMAEIERDRKEDFGRWR